MGSWDYYCALCGSTFFSSHIISRKPRTARFNRRRRRSEEREARREAKEARAQEKRHYSEACVHYIDEINDPDPLPSDSETHEHNDREDDTDSLDSYDENHSYDPEVIKQEDIAWVTFLQCIGFNPQASGLSK